MMTVDPVLVTWDDAATAVPVMVRSSVVIVVVQLAVLEATAQLTSMVLGARSGFVNQRFEEGVHGKGLTQ